MKKKYYSDSTPLTDNFFGKNGDATTKINLSSTFMVRSRCKYCLSGPSLVHIKLETCFPKYDEGISDSKTIGKMYSILRFRWGKISPWLYKKLSFTNSYSSN